MLRVGVIGVGVMGGGHVRYIAEGVPGAEVVAVYDADSERADRVVTEHTRGASVLDVPALIEQVDAVIVATPDPTHAELAQQCIEVRKPVLMEKPLAIDPVEARGILDAEAAAGTRLISVGFMRRYDPAHVAIHSAIGAGIDGFGIGAPVLFKGVHRNAVQSPYTNTRSTVSSSGIHDIDSARWFLGEFTRVSAFGRSTRADANPNLVVVHGEHSSGALSSIEVWVDCQYGYEVTAELVGDTGVATTCDPDRAVLRIRNQRGPYVPSDWLGRFEDAYRLELIDWVRSCTGGPAFRGATAWDGYRDQVVAETILQSIARDGEPVDVPTD